jgi:hypothetical protein
MAPPPPEETKPPARAFGYVLFVLWVVPAVLLTAGILFLPDENADGQCEGLGFGCTLAPS